MGYWKCSDKGKNISYMEFKKIPDGRKQELPPGIQKISDKGYLVSRINSKEEITSQHFVFLVKSERIIISIIILQKCHHKKV